MHRYPSLFFAFFVVGLPLTSCVFTVDHEMDEDTEPTVSIDGPDSPKYVDGPFSIDYQIECNVDGCEDHLQCRVFQGDQDPEFHDCDPSFTVTNDDVEDGLHTVEAQFVDDTDGEPIAAQKAQTAVLLELQLYVDGIDSQAVHEFAHPWLGDVTVECPHHGCELISCQWDDDVDASYDPDDCAVDDPFALEIESGTEAATLTIRACAEPTYPDDDIDHCTEQTYEFAHVDPVFASISGAFQHTCGLLDDHSLWCWGLGSDGRLGLGDDTDYDYPTEPVERRWRQLSAGYNHTCAIDFHDQLYCWGNNEYGQVLPQADAIESSPHPVEQPTYSYDWEMVSAGFEHTCAIAINLGNDDREVLCWGNDEYEQLGSGLLSAGFQIQTPPDDHDTWLDIASGDDHTCAIAGDDEADEGDEADLYCWGRLSFGRLGDGQGIDGPSDDSEPNPQKVDGPFDDQRAVEVSSGLVHSCAIADGDADDRQVYCWGRANSGNLGNGSEDGWYDEPQAVAFESGDDFHDVDSLSVGRSHSCATIDGDAYCWGDNDFGILGVGEPGQRPHPTAVDWTDIDDDVTVDVIEAGIYQSCALTDGGDAYCWGGNSGRLGVAEPDENQPKFAPAPVHWPFAPN